MSTDKRSVKINLIFCLVMALANVWAVINACVKLGRPDGHIAKNWLTLVLFAIMSIFFIYSAYKDYKFIRKL